MADEKTKDTQTPNEDTNKDDGNQFRYYDADNPPKVKEPDDGFDVLKKIGVPGDREERLKTAQTAVGAIQTGKGLYKSSAGRFVKGASSRKGKNSIVGMAAKNTFEFPVFVSKSVPLDYATATNSLLEQVYASYLQMAISLDPLIDKKTALTGGPFSSFKTNITKYVEYTDMFYAHDACYASYENDDYVMEFNMISITDTEARVINEAVDYQPLSEFDHFFQESDDPKPPTNPEHGSDFYRSEKQEDKTTGLTTSTPSKSDQISNDLGREKDWQTIQKLKEEYDAAKKQNQILQKQLDKLNDPNSDEAKKLHNDVEKGNKELKDLEDRLDKQLELLTNQVEQSNNERDVDKDYVSKFGVSRLGDVEEIINRRKKLIYDWQKSGLDVAKLQKDLEAYDNRLKMEIERHNKDMMTRGPQMMDETKIQKLNTMKPLMMTVQLKVVDNRGGISAPVEYIIGVKTHCRLVDPETLPDVVSYPLKKMDRLTRKAKWRAGEIKFFDYLFNIKEKKQTAIDSRDPKRKWYRRLYELAHKKGDANVAARISGNNKSGLIPNATIMLSQTDVDNIKSQTDINLLHAGAAKRLCNELFLMSLIIIDLDAESIKILLPDINNDYEVHSLASVKKQLAQLDTAGDKARDMFKLLGK